MTNLVSSNQPLHPGHTDQVQRSIDLGATSGATCTRTLNAPQMLSHYARSGGNHRIESRFCPRNIWRNMFAPPEPQADASEPQLPDDHRLLRLTAQQQQALELLGAGCTDKLVCQRLNINRGTLYRWRTTHPRFMAELARTTATPPASPPTPPPAAPAIPPCKIVLTHLRTQPKKSLDIAVRLLCSPQLTRLTASARPGQPPGHPRPTPIHPAIQPRRRRRRHQTPQPAHRRTRRPRTTGPARSSRPNPHNPLTARFGASIARRPPRPDLLDAFRQYGCTDDAGRRTRPPPGSAALRYPLLRPCRASTRVSIPNPPTSFAPSPPPTP